MKKPGKAPKTTRKRHSEDYKAEALRLADKVGVTAAARQLGLHESQLYDWRSKSKQRLNVDEHQQALETENARLKRQLAEQAEELAIFKKGRSVLRAKREVRYAFMKQHAQEFSVTAMCRVLEVSRSGYYSWRARAGRLSPRILRRRQLDQRVSEAFADRKGRSGSPELVLDLRDGGIHCNRKTVANSMREQGLRAKAARKFKATTNSKHSLPVAPNLLDQKFVANQPNEKWVGDITYLWTNEGWLYLAVMIDLYSRMVVGWAMSERMTTPLVTDALMMALWRRQKPGGVIVHSDRGSQYCSYDYQRVIADHKLVCSMSRKGNCYDNACAESFFHSLKVEMIHGEQFATRAELKQAVFEYIEVDYNRNRRHSANGRISPAAFETQQVA